jgi:hypothetical protein
MSDEIAHLTTQLTRWLEAYPLEVFLEPDLAKAREALKAADMTLDAIAVSSIRWTLRRVLEMCAAYE